MIVKHLHKKGDAEYIQNYRPISLVSVVSRILEKVMYTRLTVFIRKSNILTEAQNGFRWGKSTERAIRDFRESIEMAIV